MKYKEATKYRSAQGLPSASEGDRAYRQMLSDASEPSARACHLVSDLLLALHPYTAQE